MGFLAPLFFAALAALAIPVLLHLIQREKKQIQHFPSLMFVRRIPYKSVQRRRIHNWLLLIVRMAALALIIAAFSRPFFSGASAESVRTTGAREVVVLLDQSYSLGYGDRWQRAQAAANDAIATLGSGDRGSLVVFATGADILMRSSVEQQPLRAAVASASPTAGATRYAPALKVAGSILAESTLPRREVVLISDFQRNGWRGEEGARLPAGTVLTPVAITSAADQANVGVTAVSLGRSTFSNQERVAVTAAIVNRSSRPMQGGTISLEVGGRAIQTRQLDVDAEGTASITFDPFTVAARYVRGTVRVGNDALAADNAFNFVVSPPRPLRVVVVERAGGGGVHLMRALAIGDMPRLDPVARQAEAVTDADLRGASVVVLNDIAVSSAFARRLAAFVENGGGLFAALGPRSSWPSEVDLLPGAPMQAVDRTRGDVGRVGGVEYGHPVFEPFRAPRSGDFSGVRFYGYRSVKPAEGAQVLARFDGGTPALLERRVGDGRVLLFASTLDLSWSDLPIKPVYLPFVHQSIRHLAAYTAELPWLTVGQVLDSSIGSAAGTDSAGQRVVLTPSGARVQVGDDESEVVGLTESGFYEIRRVTGDAELAVVASNVDAAESDLTAMDPKEIVAATRPGAGDADGGTADAVPLTPEAQERSQRLWWYLLWVGLALLGADTLISNRLSKA